MHWPGVGSGEWGPFHRPPVGNHGRGSRSPIRSCLWIGRRSGQPTGWRRGDGVPRWVAVHQAAQRGQAKTHPVSLFGRPFIVPSSPALLTAERGWGHCLKNQNTTWNPGWIWSGQ